jgi:hypothetical protein
MDKRERPLITPFSSVHWVVCPSLYDLWWSLSLFSIGLSALLLFMASDDPFHFCPLGFLSFSLLPLMSPRKESSEAIKRRTDNPMDKRESGHQRP